MPSLNEVKVIGHLGKDAEVRIAGNNDVASFSVATSYRYKKQGESEYTEETEWHNITLWKPSDYLRENLVKGALVCVSGRLKTDVYEKNGEKRYATKIIAERVLIFPKGDNSGNRSEHSQSDASYDAPDTKTDNDLPF